VPYQTVIQRWHDFYVVAGTAAATLVGLLFVGLSLHLRAVLSRSEVRSLARVTLANFGLLLIVSLFMVIPEGQSAASTQLLVSGLFSLAVITPSLVAAGRSKTRTLRPYKLVISARRAASAAVSATSAPSSARSRVASRSRFQTIVGMPARKALVAIPWPIEPMPRKAILVIT
jgi:hypothetical protein